jgi:hypothetical protein
VGKKREQLRLAHLKKIHALTVATASSAMTKNALSVGHQPAKEIQKRRRKSINRSSAVIDM